MLEVAVVKLEEKIEEKVNELPLDEVLEMVKDPEAEVPILEIAIEKIKDSQDLSNNGPSIIDPVIEKEAMELPMEILLEMAKDPEVTEEILDVAVVRLEETIEETVAELPLEEVLEMVKDPEVKIPILEMAVEKIKDVLDLNDNKPLVSDLAIEKNQWNCQ